MTLAGRLAALVQRIGSDVKAILPRIVPTGGAMGSVLVKSSAADGATKWQRDRRGFAFPISGKPAAGEMIGPWVSDSTFTIDQAMSECIGKSTDAPFTSIATFTLVKNGVDVATATFAANASTPTFSTPTAADIVVSRGDDCYIRCPAQQDATGSGIGLTFVGRV